MAARDSPLCTLAAIMIQRCWERYVLVKNAEEEVRFLRWLRQRRCTALRRFRSAVRRVIVLIRGSVVLLQRVFRRFLCLREEVLLRRTTAVKAIQRAWRTSRRKKLRNFRSQHKQLVAMLLHCEAVERPHNPKICLILFLVVVHTQF